MNHKEKIINLLKKADIVAHWMDEGNTTNDSTRDLMNSLCPDNDYNEIINFLKENHYFNDIRKNLLKTKNNYNTNSKYFKINTNILKKEIIKKYLINDEWQALRELHCYYHKLIKKELNQLTNKPNKKNKHFF